MEEDMSSIILRKVIKSIHSGDPITNEELSLAIEDLSYLERIFGDINIPSMPEYNVFAKAIRSELTTLNRYKESRII
jgi:hypothetical protein